MDDTKKLCSNTNCTINDIYPYMFNFNILKTIFVQNFSNFVDQLF